MVSPAKNWQEEGDSRLFGSILWIVVALSIVLSWKVMHTPVLKEKLTAFKKLEASFLMAEAPKPTKVVEKPKVKPVEKTIPEEIEKPTLKPVEETPIVEEPVVKPENVEPPRKVYGLRKVYSHGLGSGSGGSDAVVAKLGNSLEVPPDTITATQADLKGEVVSATRISQMPVIEIGVKPEYTDEMKKNAVQGKVKARVLVDTDGIAKKIIILADLGFGTKEASIEAIRKMKFAPAQLEGRPVAVWIPITFRFELQA